jgi:glucuronosyltransferase
MRFILKALAIFLSISQVLCANILFLHGMISPSHHLWNRHLAKSLGKRGHNVTFISVDKETEKYKNVHYIVLEGVQENFVSNYDVLKMALEARKKTIFNDAKLALEYCLPCNSAGLNSRNGLEKILNYPDDFKFDLVINDFTCGSYLLPLVHKFKYPPVVAVTAYNNPSYSNLFYGGHKYASYVPQCLTSFPQIMSFYQRIVNHLIYWTEK